MHRRRKFSALVDVKASLSMSRRCPSDFVRFLEFNICVFLHQLFFLIANAIFTFKSPSLISSVIHLKYTYCFGYDKVRRIILDVLKEVAY